MGIETDALAFGVVGGSIFASSKARKERRAAARAQARIASRQRARERQQVLRESQRASAQITAGAAGTGTLGASAFQGGVASVQTQAFNNASFITQIDTAQKEIQKRLERASQFEFTAQTLGQIASTVTGFAAPTGPATRPASAPTPGTGG